MNRVILWINGGPDVGLGHATRGVGLAKALNAGGVPCEFLVPAQPLLQAWIARHAPGIECRVGGSIAELRAEAASASLVVVDSYAVTSAELASLATVVPVVCFDDGGRPRLDVDIVVNGGAGGSLVGYTGRPDTEFLLGTGYQVLRPDFSTVRPPALRPRVERIFVTLGGADPRSIAGELAEYLVQDVIPMHQGLEIDFVIGPFVRTTLPTARGLSVHRDPSNLVELMLAADLAISGAGQSLYELACCGRPTIAVLLGEDQRLNLDAFSAANAVLSIGQIDERWRSSVGSAVERSCADFELRRGLAECGRGMSDGRGAQRIAARIADRLGAGKESVSQA